MCAWCVVVCDVLCACGLVIDGVVLCVCAVLYLCLCGGVICDCGVVCVGLRLRYCVVVLCAVCG